MKIITAIFLSVILFACSPKYMEFNDHGFGGGSQSFKKADSHSKSKLEKFINHEVENEKQISEKIGIEPENLQSASPENSRYTSLKNQKANHKSQRLLQFKKRVIQNPKLSNIIEKLTFKSKTQKKNEIDSKVVNVWYKIFIISIVIAACLFVGAFFLFFGTSLWELALEIFWASFLLGVFSLVVGFITLILWLISQ